MPKSTRGPARGPAPDSELVSLGDELRRLEEIVRRLEADDMDLDHSLAVFEEGVRRLRSARDLLSEAELKVQQVLEEAGGSLRLADLDD
jgi:exodeoxyribonuclease VII small subunit